MARILIADDSEPTRIALKTLFALRPQWKICGEAENGREAVAKATKLQPDMIVLDFKMPLSNGLRAAGEISKIMPTTPMVMYTFDGNADLEIIAKLAGIWRVVAKKNGAQELLSAMTPNWPSRNTKRNPNMRKPVEGRVLLGRVSVTVCGHLARDGESRFSSCAEPRRSDATLLTESEGKIGEAYHWSEESSTTLRARSAGVSVRFLSLTPTRTLHRVQVRPDEPQAESTLAR
jgi:CheY-like chemotaxis protein